MQSHTASVIIRLNLQPPGTQLERRKMQTEVQKELKRILNSHLVNSLTETFRLAVRLGPTLFSAVQRKSPVTSLQTISQKQTKNSE